MLARAGFATADAGMLALVGPSGQEANIAMFAGDFLVSVHVGVSPAPAVSWGEDHDGLKLFPKAVLGRQSDERRLETAGWLSLERWARQRSNRLASRRAGFGARSRARRRAAQQVGAGAQGRIRPRKGAWRAHAPGCPG